jgi:glycosyltransferase involved in cell wall biosynthesis
VSNLTEDRRRGFIWFWKGELPSSRSADAMTVERQASPAKCLSDSVRWPLVSIIIPVRDEIRHIESCLRSILRGDWPVDRLEILVVDGMSSDGSRNIVRRIGRDHPQVRLLDNKRQSIPEALNLGVTASQGEIIMRMDAHALYPENYIPSCVYRLLEWDADNVGGVCITLPGAGTALAHAIALALSHPFGVGGSRFRIGVSQPCWVDTVPFGCWRRTVFQRIGLFDTVLLRNEDDEFNARLCRSGGRILLDPKIRPTYFARPHLRQLARMLFQYGYYKPFVAYKIGRITTRRQLAPVSFVVAIALLGLLGSAWWPAWLALGGLTGLHLVTGLVIGLWGFSDHGGRITFLLPLVFLTAHVSYGWGYLRGLFSLALRGRPVLRATVTR